MLRAVRRRGRRRGAAGLRHRHQRHPHSIELTKAAAEAGADAALIVTPYYNKPNPAGIRAHFEAIAAAVPELPLIAYNIPSRVVVNVPPEDLAELAKIDSVVAVKQANNDELGPIEGLDVLAGNDDIFFATLEIGGCRRHSASPRTWSGRRCARSGTRPRPATWSGRGEIDAEPAAALRRARRDDQPDPGQGGAGDARLDSDRQPETAAGAGRRRAAGDGAGTALESVGLAR